MSLKPIGPVLPKCLYMSRLGPGWDLVVRSTAVNENIHGACDDASEDDFTTVAMFLSPSPNESHGATPLVDTVATRQMEWLAGPTTLRRLIEIYGSIRFEICLQASLSVCRGRKYQSARCIKLNF